MPIVYDPAPVFLGLDGLPLNGGWVGFFDSGTDTPKDVYSDDTLSTPVANPQVLGADGRMPTGTGVWYGYGTYRVRLYDAQGAEIWVRDGIDGLAPVLPLSVTRNTVETMDDLRALAPGAYGAVEMLGFYTPADGGGGVFAWRAGISPLDNGGTIIQPDAGGVGRWVRLTALEADPRWFGAVPGQTTTATTFLGYAWIWAKSVGQALHIPGGQYDLGGNITFAGEGTLIIDEGASFANSTGASVITIDCTNADIRSVSPLIDSACTLDITNGMEVRPEWWGVTGGAGEGTQWTAVVVGSDGSSVRLRTAYTIDGGSGLDFVGGMVFEPAASLSVSTGIRIRSVTVESRDPSDYLFLPLTANFDIQLDIDEIPAWWFYLGTLPTVDATGYTRLVMNATHGGTKTARIVWEKFALFDFQGITTVPDHVEFLTSKVMPGSIVDGFYFGANLLGMVEAGNYRIFDPSGNPPILSQPGPLEWFGGVQNDSTAGAANADALVSASLHVSEIDGLGTAQKYLSLASGGYYIAGAKSFARLIARDLCLVNSGTAALKAATDSIVNATNCMFLTVFDPMTTKGTSYEMSGCRVSGNVSASADLVNLQSCQFSGEFTLFNTTVSDSNLRVRDSSFGAFTMSDGYAWSGVISNCTITETNGDMTLNNIEKMTVSGNSGVSSNNQLLIDSADGCTITGNTFRDLRFSDMNYCTITGNTGTSTTARNVMSGTGCTVLGNNCSYRSIAGSYTFDVTTLPATLNNYNV